MRSLQLIVLAQIALLLSLSFASPLANSDPIEQQAHDTPTILSYIPDYMLEDLARNEAASSDARARAARTLEYRARLRVAPHLDLTQPAKGHSDPCARPLPLQMHQQTFDSPTALHLQMEGPAKNTRDSPRLFRCLYDAKQGSQMPGTVLRTEKQIVQLDGQGTRVWEALGLVFRFYHEKFGRNSINDRGMPLVCSIHADQYAGSDANWNSSALQMAFGDGDKTHVSGTRMADVIGHEYTHGVTQYAAGLPYESQCGSLHEHLSDAFGSMVKQWLNNESSEKADWLIGKGFFYANSTAAIRSMKAPGTARVGVSPNPQADHMKKYQKYQNDYEIYYNNGIPNKAFYLVATKIGGHSWEVAGKIWYDVLTDPALKDFASKKAAPDKCFQTFADLTLKKAESGKYKVRGKDVAAIVQNSWQAVGITASSTASKTRRPAWAMW